MARGEEPSTHLATTAPSSLCQREKARMATGSTTPGLPDPLADRVRRPPAHARSHCGLDRAVRLASVPPFINMVGVCSPRITLLFGTDEQKTEHLESITRRARVVSSQRPGADPILRRSRLALTVTATSMRSPDRRCGARTVGSATGASAWRAGSTTPRRTRASASSSSTCTPGVSRSAASQMPAARLRRGVPRRRRVPANCLLARRTRLKVGMATLTNERGHIGASTISLQRRLEAWADLGGDLDAVHSTPGRLMPRAARTSPSPASRCGWLGAASR